MNTYSLLDYSVLRHIKPYRFLGLHTLVGTGYLGSGVGSMDAATKPTGMYLRRPAP
ncbi:hypothetical protein [Methylocucumis oryzae]|uniref:hypothetical protein n=1 Tax=Methylocucumis oryzae TaxID=1632867 RepID=UPI0012FE91B4|nr:hypothetical protein [Methylocucumis oryzae]